MKHFRTDNTEGFTQDQLDGMNKRLEEMVSDISESDPNYLDTLDHYAEQVCNEYA